MKIIRLKHKKIQGSLEHIKYVKHEKMKNILINISRVFILLFILGAWEFVADKNWVDPFITSSPSRIVKQTILLYENGQICAIMKI